jgi:hypothetical protein
MQLCSRGIFIADILAPEYPRSQAVALASLLRRQWHVDDPSTDEPARAEPADEQYRRGSRAGEKIMNKRITAYLSLAAALAMSASTIARAAEPSMSSAPTAASERTAPTLAKRRGATARHAVAPSAATLGSSPRSLVVPTLGHAIAAPNAPSSDVAPSIDLDEAPPLPASNAPSMLARFANGPRTLVLSSALFEDREPLELLSSVLLPAARGVTIAQIQPEGAPAFRLTVRPTKIARGSGLVAVGQF